MAIEAGGAFICNDDALTEDNQHLWVIVSDPGAHPECCRRQPVQFQQRRL
jgi:hypothetical protein